MTVLVGAFLLFQVQPVISKIILPWFGGGPSVWTTCLLFFQVLLVAGYAYAHVLSRYVPIRRQAWVHGILVLLSLLTLPILPGEAWKPTDADFPMLRILFLLLVSVEYPICCFQRQARWSRPGLPAAIPSALPIDSMPCRMSARWEPF